MILSNTYQYIGRSNGVKAYGSSFYFYILLYAKTTGSATTGKHTVSIKMRLACTINSTFYDYSTTGWAKAAGISAIEWSQQLVPNAPWNTSNLTEGGVTYPRWIDLRDGTAVIDTGYNAEKEITITAYWKRLDISSPPSWLASTTPAEANIRVNLPAIADPTPEPEPEPDPEPEPEPEEPEPEPEPELQPDPTIPVQRAVTMYSDGILAYDSRLEDYDLAGLKVTTGLNVGGTAEIILPRDHPAYNYFIPRRTVVTIYRDGVLRFRGRVLYLAENFLGQRTVTCEGELGFLQDGINRPYLYQSSPAKIFRTIIQAYNEQMSGSEFKLFKIGRITVTDPNDYIRLESESAGTFLATMNKLLERCGGYITFTTAASGGRIINWLASLNSTSAQTIEFGENLLDFTSTGANNTSFATGIIPYGAKDETTKKRITIESVNDGLDYLIDEVAAAIYGNIVATVTWDDVTEPENLLKKAQAYLAEHKVLITSLSLTALDLSYLDKDIDKFAVGDMILVVSAPHGINEYFQLTQLTEDLLNPAQNRITLGKEIQSLTGSGVASDFKNQSELESVKVHTGTDIEGVASTVEESVLEKASKIYAQQDIVEALTERIDGLEQRIEALEE